MLLQSFKLTSPVAPILAVTTLLGSFIGMTPVVLSQSNPPDVVVDTESSRSTRGSVSNPTSGNLDKRFTCQFYQGAYTVMYSPQSEPNQRYPWAVPEQMGGGWTPQKRCEAISQRLEQYRPDGLLELKTAQENNYEVVCVTSQQDPSCRIVFTVPPGQNARVARDRVFDNLIFADSGQQTQGVVTFTGNQGLDILNQVGEMFGINRRTQPQNINSGINLRPFLDRNDGGTGTQLQPSSRNAPSNTSSPSLNPDNFR